MLRPSELVSRIMAVAEYFIGNDPGQGATGTALSAGRLVRRRVGEQFTSELDLSSPGRGRA